MARKTRDLAEVIRRKLAANPALAAAVDAERFGINVGREIYRARIESKLTQRQLADRIGTHQSAIARLEDADYEGHSLTMLRRIGDALGQPLRIEFRPRPNHFQETVSVEGVGIPTPQWADEGKQWSHIIEVSSVGTSLVDVHSHTA